MFQCLELSIPDLLILDVFACGIDQAFITSNLREQPSLKTIPIIVTSTSPSQIKDLKSYDANESLEKPFDIEVLRTKVYTLLGNY